MKLQKGEKKLIRRTVTDSEGSDVVFDDLVGLTVVLTDSAGATTTYTKGGSPAIVQGESTNQLEFEITVAQSNAFAIGNIDAEFTFTITNSDFSDSEEINILRETKILEVV